MSILTKSTHLALSYLPKKLVDNIRSLLPVTIKSFLGEKLMKEAAAKINKPFIEVPDGRRFKVIADGHFLRIIYEKTYEPLLSTIASKLILENDIVIDVGANFGWYTTLFALRSNGGVVISYEPVPYSYDILEENVTLNKTNTATSIRKVGVGQTKGTFLMEPASKDGVGGSLAHVVNNSTNTTIEVDIVTLDTDLSKYINRISYMKLDIEGFEYNALKGANSILSADNQPILQIELNDEALERSGSSRKEILEYLKGLGYTFYEASPNLPGYLQVSNTNSCSDVFCFGKGKHSQRLSSLLRS